MRNRKLEQRELAFAKLTTTLRVTGVRDDGYHLIKAEMVTIDLYDVLTFSAGNGLEVHLDAKSPAGLMPLDIPQGEDNLVCKALRAVGRPALVLLHKRIPPGAGLGGGSADAAAALRWAGCGDLNLAASLGADVPFCLAGGRALVSGIGEEVLPLDFEERAFVLLLPPFAVSTVAVYGRWDALGGPAGDWGNDLEEAAVSVEPRLGAWRDAFAAAAGRRPRLAGSGATWFLEGTPEELGLTGTKHLELNGDVAVLVPVRTVRSPPAPGGTDDACG